MFRAAFSRKMISCSFHLEIPLIFRMIRNIRVMEFMLGCDQDEGEIWFKHIHEGIFRRVIQCNFWRLKAKRLEIP